MVWSRPETGRNPFPFTAALKKQPRHFYQVITDLDTSRCRYPATGTPAAAVVSSADPHIYYYTTDCDERGGLRCATEDECLERAAAWNRELGWKPGDREPGTDYFITVSG